MGHDSLYDFDLNTIQNDVDELKDRSFDTKIITYIS